MLSKDDATLKPLIENGDIAIVDKVVKVKVGKDTKTVEFKGIEARTVKGAAAIMAGKIDAKDDEGNIERQTVLGAFNYAVDLFQRANERTKATAGLIDPQKAIDGAVKALMKLGFTEQKAREMAKMQTEDAEAESETEAAS